VSRWQHGPMTINTSSIAHVRLTVTDILEFRDPDNIALELIAPK
jgi:hypothetical protein